MEKKRPWGVIIGWIVVSSNIIFLIIYHSKMIQGETIWNLGFSYFAPLSPFFAMNDLMDLFYCLTLIPLINICLGIGIVFLRNITRILFVILQVINGLIVIATMLYFARGIRINLAQILQLLFDCLAIFVYAGYIIALTRPKVKEQFR